MSNKTDKKILSGLKHHTAKDFEVLSGFVKSVDEGSATMVVTLNDGDVDIEDVMLNGVANELNGIIPIPAADSDVVIASVDGPGEYVLIRASKLTKVIIKCDNVLINDGTNKGLVILDELKANLDALKSYCEALTSATSTGLAAVGAGTAASGTLGKQSFDGNMASQSISFGNMENTKVKH